MLRSDRVASGHSQRILQEDHWSWRIESRPRTQFEKIRTTPTSTPIFHRNVAYASKRRPYSAIAIRNDLGGRLRRFGFKVDVVGMVEGMAFVSWHGLGFKHCRALHSQDGGSRWRAVFDENHRLLQFVGKRMVFTAGRRERRIYTINRLVQQVLKRSVLPKARRC